jgi:glycosyltransferase involved in cell wall biosynthesis
MPWALGAGYARKFRCKARFRLRMAPLSPSTSGTMDSPTSRDEKIDVWMVIPSFTPLVGGAETQVRQLSSGLIARGWRVRVLTRRVGCLEGEQVPSTETINGTPVTRIDSAGSGKLGSTQYLVRGLWHLMRHGRGAVYHAHDVGTPGLIAAFARRFFGGRSIVKLRTGRLTYERQFDSAARRWLFKRLLTLHDRVIVVNREVEQYLEELGIPSGLIVRLPNAVDGHVFVPSATNQKQAVRRSLGITADRTIVLYVGRLRWVKGVDVLIEAWAALPQSQRRNAMLLIVGDGEERLAIQRRIDLLGLRQSISLVGEQTDVQGYYAAADLFVLPSRTEGLSNALAEAMACGLPVVGSRVGGTPDIVMDGINGITFESENHLDLAARLEEMLFRRDEWATMGLNGRQTVLQYADFTTILDSLVAIYQSLWQTTNRT